MVHIQLVPSLLPFNYVRHCFTSSVLCFWLFLELLVSCIFHSFCACLFFVCTLFLLQRFVSSSSLLCGFFVRSSLSVQFVSEKIGKGEFLQILIYWNFDLLKFWSLTAGEVWTQTQLWIRSKNSWEGFTRLEDPCFLTPFPRFSPTEVFCRSHISTDLPRLAPASAQVGGPGWRQDGSLSLVGGSQSAVHTSL